MNLIVCSRPSSFINKYTPGTHECWEIVYQTDGDVEMQLGNKHYYICPENVMVIPPHCFHVGESESGFKDLFLQAKALDFQAPIVTTDFGGEIRLLLEMIYKTTLERQTDYTKIADALLDTVCYLIKRNASMGKESRVVSELKQLIYDNLSSPEFDLASAILATGFHKDHLRRCFKRETGKTPLEYMTDLRLNYAKSLLKRTDFLSVEEVAASAGFSDTFYFSTCFKKHFGLSPLKYHKAFFEKTEH